MKEYISILIWVAGVSADSYDFGRCQSLQDPVASHPRQGGDVKAGRLSVYEEDGEIVARTICDNEQGFILMNNRHAEMRCSYNKRTGVWSWSHLHRDRRSPPTIRCAHVSPQPVIQQFNLGPNFKGCSEPDSKAEVISSLEERLSSSLPCVLSEECTVSELSCEVTDTTTVLSVKVTSRVMQRVKEQRLILETAVEYLKSYPLHVMLSGPSGTHSRQKRQFDFGNAVTEDVVQAGCDPGYIENADSTCAQCAAGTYANTVADPQECTLCALDTYSAIGATECVNCGSGLGTLEVGSDAAEDCIAICSVPTIAFVDSTDPESRVVEGGNVDITCEANYAYGNSGTKTVVCSSSTNNFPASCRKVTISAPQTSIKAGDSGIVSCVVEAGDVGAAIHWLVGESTTPLVSDDAAYTIATTLATQFEADGKTKKSTSDLSILNFDAADAASYSCAVDYADPILDDNSAEQALAILGLVVTPSSAQILSAGASLELSCSMDIDDIYVTRAVTWKLNNGDDITSGVTTSTTTVYNSILSLSSVALSDAGTYTCSATYSHSDGSNPVSLTGTVSVTVRGFETDPVDVNANLGSQVVISCIVVGDKQATISWTKGVDPVSGSVDSYTAFKTTSTLTIAAATADDAGEYKCKADFGGAEVESAAATVAVYDIGITINPADVAHLVGEDAELSCTVKNPAGVTPSLSWYKVVGETTTALDVSLTNFDNANPGKSTLTFSSATLENAGVYKCEAVYVIGEVTITRESTTATLYIRELSKSLDEYTAVTALGGSQTFTCEYHGDSAVSGVTWTYNDVALPAGYTATPGSYLAEKWESVLTLNPVIKSSGGVLKCAYSFSGVGDEITSITNFRVRSVDALAAEIVSSDASHTVTCNYKGTDEPSVSWTVGGSIVSDSDAGITITPGTLNVGNERSDELTISGRTYSDASKAIVCKYSFTNPTAELSANTVLKFRGLNAGLNTKYYSIGAAVTLECSLGVGSDGTVPTSTAWYKNYVDTDSTPVADTDPLDVETETSVTNGLFKTTLTIKTAGITTANAGNYRCLFVVSGTENYHSEGALVIRLVTKTPSEADVYSYANLGLKLSCTLDASDIQSGITWTGPDGVIDSSKYSNDVTNQNIFILSLANSATSGEYKCTFAFADGTSTVPEGVFSNVNLNLVELVSPAALYSTYGAGVKVTLTCQVTSPSKLVLGFHDGTQDLAATSTTYVDGKTKAEYEITVDAANKAGTFTCRKSETEFSPTSSALTVFSISTPLVTPTRGNSASSANLVCVAESHPDITAPTFSWLVGETAATETANADVPADDGSSVSSTLPIVISSTNDASVYKCVATYTGLAAGTNLDSTTTITMNKIVTSATDTVRAFAGTSVIISCVATADNTVNILWRKKAADWTADTPTFDPLTGAQDPYIPGSGTRKSTLTLSSPTATDTSDHIECYDEAIGISGVIALEVIETTAGHTEVLSKSQAVISCDVTGLLEKLTAVTWEKESAETITDSMTDYEVVEGEYNGETKTQTTTLTVKNGINTVDSSYKCVVNRGVQSLKTAVQLKIFTVTSTPKPVTTAVDQTLTCTISGLDADKAVAVTWKEPGGSTVSDDDNYDLLAGTVTQIDGSGVQNAVLTIKAAKLADAFAEESSFTYKCSVTSSQYTASPPSTEVDVVANVVRLAVEAGDKEQLAATQATIFCKVTGLTKKLDTVQWKKAADSSTITTGVGVFTIDEGDISDDGSQTTTLTVPVAETDTDKIYKCVVTSVEHGGAEQSKDVHLKVFTVTSTPKPVTTAVDQTLTCTISGLDADKAVAVTWKEPGGSTVSDDDNYDLLAGTVTQIDGSGVQNAVLTIKAAKLADAFAEESSFTYKCSVTSSQYTASPPSTEVDVVANVVRLAVEAGDKEQLAATQATIFCKVTGLTKKLDTVQWKKAADSSTITTGVGVFTIDEGDISDDGSQTTTLTVPVAETDTDKIYKCVVTSVEHGGAEQSKDVHLKVFTVTSTPKPVTTAVDQTLTCTISGLDADKAVAVTWKEPGGSTVSDDDNYDLLAGTVTQIDGSGVQNAVLTIKAAKLADAFAEESSFTYKCSVTSSQYTASPPSTEVDVVANVVTLAVEAGDKEQLAATQATIFCKVTGLTKKLDTVQWKKAADSSTITTGVGVFTIDEGDISDDGSQTTTLTVPVAETDTDKIYKCVVTSVEHGGAEQSKDVHLKVFTVTSTPKPVTTAVDQTLTCTISGLDADKAVAVTWKEPGGSTVSDDDNYDLLAGTVTQIDGSGVQNAVLTIKAAKLADAFAEESSFTYKCSVTSSQYTASPPSTEVDVVANVVRLEVTSKSTEVLQNTQATISCVVAGLTKKLDAVAWKKGDQPITSGVAEGSFVPVTNSQTSELTIPAAAETTTYSCFITSLEHGVTLQKHDVNVNVFKLSALDAFYYSPQNVELTVDGPYEPQIVWSVGGQTYSADSNPNLNPSVKTAWSGTEKVFNLAFDMAKFSATIAPFAVSGILSLGAESTITFPVGPFTIYKREFSQSLSASLTVVDGDFPAEFNCAAQGEDKSLFSISWKIGETAIDDDFKLATAEDTSEALSATEKKSKLTIPANNQIFNNELKCVATWTGDNAAAIDTKTDINAIGASLDAQTFSTGSTGDGDMVCLVWGDSSPFAVSWKNPKGEAVTAVENEIVITSKAVGAVYTNTLSIKAMTFGDEGQYTCSVVFNEGEAAKEFVTQLNKLSASFSPASPYFVHGKSLAFNCVYNGLEDPTKVEWFKGSTDAAEALIADGDKYGIATGQFNIASRSKTSTITFKNVAVTDTGDYTCKWDTASFDPQATMTVAIRSLTTPSATTYSLDGTITVECDYEGTTSGTIEWFHGDQKLVDAADDAITIDDGTLTDNAQKYTLTIANVNPEDNSGAYKCVLGFSDNDKLEASTEVVVRKATIIDSKGVAELSVVVSGGELSAKCMFEGDKQPSGIKWSAGEQELVFDSIKKLQNSNTKQLDNSIKYFSNITLKEFAFADQGSYTCTFEFDDNNNVEASVNVVSATVTNEECVFVDFKTETSKTLSCSYAGGDSVTGVSFTKPDNSEEAGELGVYVAGGDANTPGSQTGSYTVTGITDAASGAYKCTFTLNDGSTLSAIQRLTARKAVIESSQGPTPDLIVRSSITLTCTVASGAKSIAWLKNNAALVEGTDYEKVKVAGKGQRSDDSISKIEFDIAADSAGSYKCQGTQYDDFCTTQEEFVSEEVVLSIISATPLENPQDATAYEGGNHELSCKFPNPFSGQTYEIVWSFKGTGDSVAKPMIGNGDVYKGGERIVDGAITNDHQTTSGEISTSLNVANINSDAAGEYLCTIKWGTIFIKSTAATLTVRTISEPPKTTNVAKGGDAQLTCKTTGDSAATISFHKTSDDTPVGSVTPTSEDVAGVITTTGVLTISGAQAADSIEYYCKASWGANEVKSENVYLAVLGITEITATSWGVASKFARFKCQSDAHLKKNAAGDFYLGANKKPGKAPATNTWEYFDSANSVWKSSTEDARFRVEPESVGGNGIRVSALFLGGVNANEDGLKVRCNIAYQADVANNFFANTVTSDDMVLKISTITSFVSSDTAPIKGDTIILTCIATGETAPDFKFTTQGKKTFDPEYFELVTDTAVVTEGTKHTATYKTKAIGPTILKNGQIINCEADYGKAKGKLTNPITVTTYYDCAEAEFKSLNPVDSGVTVAATNNGDGSLTQTITCPADTDLARYSLTVSSNSAGSITCSKETGKYEPKFLARCSKTEPLTSGKGSQLLSLPGAKFCNSENAGTTWGPVAMKKKLFSMTDDTCGFRHYVPCLLNGQCTLDEAKSGCVWDEDQGKLSMFYEVTLNPGVWTLNERAALVDKTEGNIQFWTCSGGDYLEGSRRRRDLDEIDFHDFDKRAVNETGDSSALESSHFVAATTVGVCIVVLMTAFLSVLVVRMRKQQSQDIEARY